MVQLKIVNELKNASFVRITLRFEENIRITQSRTVLNQATSWLKRYSNTRVESYCRVISFRFQQI